MSGFFNRREGYGLFDNILLSLVYKYPEYVDWGYVAGNPNVTLEFIEKNLEKLKIDIAIISNPNLTLDFIEKFPYEPLLNQLLANSCLDFSKQETLDFIEKHRQNISWKSLSHNPKLTLDFIKQNSLTEIDKWDWGVLLTNPVFDFSQSEVLEYFEEYIVPNVKIDWSYFSMNPTLTFSFVEKYEDKLNWNNLSYSLKFDFSKKETLDFIEKHYDNLVWNEL